jgi:hypothetical protein
MADIRKYTDQDPIDFLVLSRFPLSRVIEGSIVDRRSRKTSRQSGRQLEEATAYRRKLSALPPEKIEQLVADQRARMVEAARQKAEQEEQARPFNQPAADADFGHWAKMSYWTLDECVALSLGRNPKMVSWPAIQSLTRISPFASEYASRREIVTRAETMGQLWQSTIPSVFLAWAERMRFQVPVELVETVKGLGIQIRDWKTAHDLGRRGHHFRGNPVYGKFRPVLADARHIALV